MRKTSSLTHRVMKSLYPQDDLDAVGEGFMVTCTEEEANKLVEDSTMKVTQDIKMLPIDMS
jgi:hypothetical protein